MDTTISPTVATEINADNAKIMVMCVLGIGSFLLGILPAWISHRNRARFPLLISMLLCFGAGVLLATALIHMLPEIRKTLPDNPELIFCAGFFLIYFVDEFVHFCCGEAIQHSHGPSSESNHHDHQPHPNSHQPNSVPPSNRRDYGTNSETQSLLSVTQSLLDENDHSPQPALCEDADEETNARICHVTHTEPCTNAMTGTFGLLFALSLHSLLEGLAIGVQSTGAQVIILFAAVACHKFVMGFCLGIELRANESSTMRSHISAIAVFSLGSVVGIGIGMGITDMPQEMSKAIPILQALAGGTLLYVTVCEVMPREKSRWHQNPRKSAGLMQFLAVGFGFAIMTVINYSFKD